MNNEEKILALLVEMKQKLEEHDKRFDSLEQRFDKAEQDNTKAFEMLAGHMIDHTTRLERMENVQKEQGESLEKIEEKLDIVKDISNDNDFEIRRLKKKLIS